MTLVPVQQGLMSTLKIETPQHNENVFLMFRKVFDAKFCGSRRVYWFEEKWGRTIVREVTNLDRKKKNEDTVLGIYQGATDLDAVRILVAQSAVGHLMTGVRWEVYSDFACTELLAMGRYDYPDLLPAREKVQQLQARQIVSCPTDAASWDFDGLLIAHTCPKCQKVMKRECVIFTTYRNCEHCRFDLGKAKGEEAMRDVTQRLMSKALQRKPVLPVLTRGANLTPAALLDIHVTPIICSLIQQGWLYQLSGKQLKQGMTAHELLACHDRSMLKHLESDYLRSAWIDWYESYECRRRERSGPSLKEHLASQGVPFEPDEWSFKESVDVLAGLKSLILEIESGKRTAEQEVKISKMQKASQDFPWYLELLLWDSGETLIEQERSR